MSRRKIEQAKLQYWAGMIHDCQHSGLKTKEWLANHGISKDTYYYWYKKVQTVCVEAMEMPDTLSMPEFMSLPVPAEPANVPVESAIRSYVVVTIQGRSISFPESLRKLAGVVISCILCNLRNGLCAPDKLYGSLFQTVFLDIVVYWHTVDLFEHFLQVRNRDPVFFCQLRKGDIPLPVCQKVIPEMVCQFGLFGRTVQVHLFFLL